jgi:D-tyrosyl-tRNA(Tyr) deacylase
MRALIQRVNNAEVIINQAVYAQIGYGLVVFLGIGLNDAEADIEWLCNKIINMRIFNDATLQMNNAITESKGQLLIVSQFTLLASTKKGNRPSYLNAAPPVDAKILYNQFLEAIAIKHNQTVASGVFGANMQINLTNDGPVTIWLDSKLKE